MSILFEVHQIKGSKITDVDEVGIDTGGICVSERGPRELPGARGDLGMLKPGQASKEKNGQVMGGGLEDSSCALLLLRALCSGSLSWLDLEVLSWRPHCSPPSWLPAQDRLFSSQFTCSKAVSSAGWGLRQEAGVGAAAHG